MPKDSDDLISDALHDFLEKKEFVYVGTADSGHPNVAPKFLIKVDRDYLFLADFVNGGKTCANLKKNSKVSVSIVNLSSLIAYQLNGVAHVIPEGPEYDELLERLNEREMKFSVERVISGVSGKGKSESFEAAFPERVQMYKVDVREVVQIGPDDKLSRRQKILSE